MEIVDFICIGPFSFKLQRYFWKWIDFLFSTVSIVFEVKTSKSLMVSFLAQFQVYKAQKDFLDGRIVLVFLEHLKWSKN